MAAHIKKINEGKTALEIAALKSTGGACVSSARFFAAPTVSDSKKDDEKPKAIAGGN